MHYIRPVWLTHSGEKKDFEVYSCHVSPDGARLVTAAGDGFVRIWSTEAIYNAADPNYAKPKQLASMSYHSGTIHSVRFAGNGHYLASGADDKILCVYKFDPNPPSHSASFGSNESPPVENWRIFRRLIGHDNDVQDLGWSYDSSILVSVGLDSKVVVWSGHTFEKLKTLVGHQSHVKGITFDPANKYFATASDDRTIKIWRFTSPGPNSTSHDQMNNFMLDKNVSDPFVASPLTTYFRRCSWSPDGNHIAAANAVNGPVSSVAIINRGQWDGDINLIGHEAPVEVCAFSPRLFCKKNPVGHPLPDPQYFPVHTVIACAGQDKALSVWITTNPRPLVIAQDMAVKSISDLAWTPDGKTLFLSTLDGTIIAVIFEPQEIGYEVSLEENDRALAKFGASRRGVGIIEGTDGLLLEERSKEGEMRNVEGRMGALMGDAASHPAALTNGNVAPLQPPTGLTNGAGTPSVTLNGGNPNQNAGPVEEQQKPKEDPNAAKLERLKNRVTITKDGKKRIAPLLVSSAGNESLLPRPQLMASSGSAANTHDQPQTILDLSKPFDGLPRGGITGLLLGNKRRMATVPDVEDDHVDKRIALASQDGAVPILSNTVNGLLPAKSVTAPNGQLVTPQFIRPAVTNACLAMSTLRLAVPKVRLFSIHTIREPNVTGSSGSDAAVDSDARTEVTIEYRNPIPHAVTGRVGENDPCRIYVTKRGQPVFQDYLPKSALVVTGNKRFWSVACEDGSVYAWTPVGRRLINALVLESQPVILECQDKWLLCITCVGMCYVWDMQSLTSPHPPISLAPVMDAAINPLQDQPTKTPAITGARLNSEGRIIVTLTNGEGYAYSPAMYVWQRLSELWWMVGSQYWNTIDSSVGNLRSTSALGNNTSSSNVSAGVIPYLERTTTNEVLARGRAQFLSRIVKQLLSKEGFEGFESSVSIAHLENRMAATMMLGAKDEFQVYLYMYAKRIGAEGLKLKVEELLRGLLGGVTEEDVDKDTEATEPSLRTPEDRHWRNKSEKLCGWPRRELLKGALLILGKNRDLQRITVPYAKVLGVVEEAEGLNADAMVS
ncbi:HIR complex subunit [Lecanora helva]